MAGSVLISERGIDAASAVKAMAALKRAEARAPPANEDVAEDGAAPSFEFSPGCLDREPMAAW